MTTTRSTFAAIAFLASLGLAACETRVPPSLGQAAPTELPSLSASLEGESASRGRAIAIIGCASCHAIDAAGASPFSEAPPFRDIVRRRSLDDLETAFGSGLVTTHPAMPPYVFRAAEIDDLIAYFGALEVPNAPEGSR